MAEFLHEKKTTTLKQTKNTNKPNNQEKNGLLVHLEKSVRTELFEIVLKIINTPNWFLKAYMLIAVVLASCLASYTVLQSFNDYFAYDVITTSRTIFETPTLFPQVMVCNINPYTTQYAYDFLKDIDTTSSFFNNNSNMTYGENSEFFKYFYYRSLDIAMNKSYTYQQRQNLAHNFDDILLVCSFNEESCTANDFVWKFDPMYGNCYVFNSGFDAAGQPTDLKRSTMTGTYYGLSLAIYTGFFEKLEKFNSYIGGRGLTIRIGNSSYMIDYDVNGILVPAGFQTNLIVDRSFKFLLPSPYSDCEIANDSPKNEGSELYRLIAQTSYQYTQQLCFIECYQKWAISTCNCSDSFVSVFNSTVCMTFEETLCLSDFFYNKYLVGNFIEQNCLPLCPLECNLTDYKTSSSSIPLLGDLYYEYIRENKNLTSDFVNRPLNKYTITESITSVNIFYNSLSYHLSTETPKLDIIGLLATKGGNLGLFLGVSLLSICELVEIMFQIYFIKKGNKVLSH